MFGSSIIYGFTGSLLFNDLRIFFSILVLPIEINGNLETLFMVMNLNNILDPSIFNSILSCHKFLIEIPQISLFQTFSSSENLIDWCYLNCEKEIIPSNIFNDFQLKILNEDFSVNLIFSYFIVDFLTNVVTLDLMVNQDFNFGLLTYCYNIHFVNSFASLELLSNLNNIKDGLLF